MYNLLKMVRSKKQLAVLLSKLQGFKQPKIKLEQYQTPSEIAAEWAWQMALNGDVEGKIIADFACGPGIIGIALLILGAKKVHFVDCDPKIIQICKQNYHQVLEKYELSNAQFHICDIKDFNLNRSNSSIAPIDIVVQNPPFGTQQKHHDRIFLLKAFNTADIVYSMHKSATFEFIRAISSDNQFEITHKWFHKFTLPKTMPHHNKKQASVDVNIWRLQKSSKNHLNN
jgi:putative methylase